MIAHDLTSPLHGYIVGALDHLGSPSIRTGGTRDHVHALFSHSRTLAIAKVAEEVKKSSSKWMKGRGVAGFTWQAGYAVFSVSESQKTAWCATSNGRKSIIGALGSKRRCGSFWLGMGFRTMSGTSGIEVPPEGHALSGLRIYGHSEPRALPWAIELLPLRGGVLSVRRYAALKGRPFGSQGHRPWYFGPSSHAYTACTAVRPWPPARMPSQGDALGDRVASLLGWSR